MKGNNMQDQSNEVKLSKSQAKKLAAQKYNEKSQETANVVLTNEQKEELEALSKEVFNSSSRYVTLMTKGELAPVTVTVTEYVPDENGGEGITREVEVPEMYRNSKAPLLKTVRHTYESVKAHMLKIKDQQDRFKAMLAKMEADKKAEQEKAKLVQEVQNKLNGSVI